VIEARYFVIAHAADIAGAENFLLRSLAHTGDDLFERNLTRPLSRLVTAWSASLRIPPDLWSVLVLLCGFLSAAGMLLFSSVESLFFPALIALAALFSAVDGETARLLFRTSPRGGILNYYSSRLALWLYFLAVTILFRDAGFLFFSGVIFLFAYPLLVIRYDRHRHRGKERPAAPWRRIERMARRHFSIHAVAFCTLAAALFGILRITLILALPLMAAGSLLALHEAISTRMERRSRP
jgi:phosphatidylglycerophosphate synthase